MNIDVTVSIDIEEIFNNLSHYEKGKFCDIVLDYLYDEELIEVLRQRDCDWSSFGLKEE